MSAIDGHRFRASADAPWGRCVECGLAESAHVSAIGTLPLALKYRCPRCVEEGVDPCPHPRSKRPEV